MILSEALAGARERLREAGSDEAAIEAEVLLRHVLGIDRTMLLRMLNDSISERETQAFEAALSRRFAGEPVAYITGNREFFSLNFEVTPATLIPRPETEMLVEAAIAALAGYAQPLIADVGTGSGAIAVALAVALPQAAISATDISEAALAVARRNAERHGVIRRISFRRGDLVEPLDERFDLIAANLPYITLADWQALPPSIRDHEPRKALESGGDGLNDIRRLLAQAPSYLKPGGLLLAEFGIGQADAIEAGARQAFPAAVITIHPDFAGIPRMLKVQT